MKKKLFALSGVFMIVLVISGLWATKAINLSGLEQTIETPAPITLANGLSMREMTEGASLIVIGRCLGTQSQWNDRRLYTLARVSVLETLKGETAGELTVALPGGIDSNRKLAMTYPGAPTMSQDEKIALFLIPEGAIENSYAVMGFDQGKFSIAEDNDGEPVVMRDMTRARVQTRGGVTRGNFQAIPLPVFKAMVMNYLR